MKNFQITDKDSGKKYWISRSVASAVVIMTEDGKFIAERRGPGCPDFIGKLAFPCGYLDFDETIEECARREVWEELGVNIKELYFVGVNSDPNSNLQNVTIRFLATIEGTPNIDSLSRGGENEEVSEVIVCTLEEILGNKEEWAFNHATLAEYVSNNLNAIKNQCLKNF